MPLWSSQAALPAQVRRLQRRRRLSHRAAGLAGSLRGLGTGMQPPLHGRLAELRLPVLCIAGGLDDKFVSIARDLTSQLPRGRLLLVPGAGHNVHLERPQEFANAVGAFLQEPKGC
jgi:pimeloyl-ACP methyl ester carboxylesterase